MDHYWAFSAHTHTHTNTHVLGFEGQLLYRPPDEERIIKSLTSMSAKEDHQPDTEVPGDWIRSRNTHTHTETLTIAHVETSVKTLLGTPFRTHKLSPISGY